MFSLNFTLLLCSIFYGAQCRLAGVNRARKASLMVSTLACAVAFLTTITMGVDVEPVTLQTIAMASIGLTIVLAIIAVFYSNRMGVGDVPSDSANMLIEPRSPPLSSFRCETDVLVSLPPCG